MALVDFSISDEQNSFHVSNIQLTTEWKQVTIWFSDLKPTNEQLKNKVTLNLNRTHEFGFGSVNEGGAVGGLGIEILVDTLRVEGKK